MARTLSEKYEGIVEIAFSEGNINLLIQALSIAHNKIIEVANQTSDSAAEQHYQGMMDKLRSAQNIIKMESEALWLRQSLLD